jgi:hypothetical protein
VAAGLLIPAALIGLGRRFFIWFREVAVLALAGPAAAAFIEVLGPARPR